MTPPKIPPYVRVAGRSCAVVADRAAMDRACHEEKSHLDGQCNHHLQQILLEPNLGPDVMPETLLHEVIHAVMDVTGLAAVLGVEDEERVVNTMTPTLFACIRENAALVSYLTANDKGGPRG